MKKIYILLLAVFANFTIQAQDDANLIGTWYLHYVEASGTITYVPSITNTYEMTITNSGTFESILGYSTCNAFASDYEILNNNSTINMNSYTETLGFCSDPFEGLHLGIMSTAIAHNFDYSIDSQTELLTLTDHLGRKLVYGKSVLTTKDNQAFSTTIKLYPNPVQKEFFVNGISSNSKATYTIYNVIGNVVTPENSLQQHKINVASLKTGIYFVKIQQEGKTGIKKFVKL
ncbi:T9SS type A sorting domain-containing protein [Kordia sp.]|uniref:T9SS type A sorting domain-containing protein n=1 Tax=Kordia sp. TaxID=1965332 RepID=UPI003B5CC437